MYANAARFALALPSAKVDLSPSSTDSTVSLSKVGNTIAGAIGLPAIASSSSVNPNVKLLPPGLKPLAKAT